MPTNRKRTRRGRNPVLPPPVVEKLVTGQVYFAPEPTPAEVEPIYRKHRDFVMSFVGRESQDIEENFFGRSIPWGERPWAWWEFDAPEPRRLLSGDPALADMGGRRWFGTPRCYASAAAHASLTFETQAAYLERLGLLLPGEAEKIDEAETVK